MDAMQNLMTRRSVRSFKPDPVPKDLLEQVIRAGVYAPSARNSQSSIILAITAPALMARLSDMNRVIMGKEAGFDPFYGAPAMLLVLGQKDWPHKVYDGSLVMGNLMLAAHTLGLGSCWIHRAREEFETPEGQAILKQLGIEGDWEGIGHCVLGYPAVDLPAPPPRKENRVFWAE